MWAWQPRCFCLDTDCLVCRLCLPVGQVVVCLWDRWSAVALSRRELTWANSTGTPSFPLVPPFPSPRGWVGMDPNCPFLREKHISWDGSRMRDTNGTNPWLVASRMDSWCCWSQNLQFPLTASLGVYTLSHLVITASQGLRLWLPRTDEETEAHGAVVLRPRRACLRHVDS